ncbi:hypothetical protein DSO57_1017915 [Entomophthora muscae]|uniref:Uncharacterized protein n=1 Tax=Entomophthora muscae TaxID=34485 RepID=A0ACC2S6I8_9FUNG|nr:hypothetical protein DSO57_1017915 [Entomophthora muscae]
MELTYFFLASIVAKTHIVLPQANQITANLFHSKKLTCLGARYRQHLVLTTASCIRLPIAEYLAVIKTNRSLEFSAIHQVIPHPLRSDYHAMYDIAILKTKGFKSPDPGLNLMQQESDILNQGAFLFGWYQPSGSWNHYVAPRRISVKLDKLESCQDTTLMMVMPYVVLCGHTFTQPHLSFTSPPGSPLLQYRGDDLILVGISARSLTSKTSHILFSNIAMVNSWIYKDLYL